MSDQLYKLRPDRDLQCYFEQPSGVAAMSGASESGFTISGSWRQQFDWAVVEWNRDNVFEHPALRNLPDGDFTGIRLSYEETRTNCVPLDSNLYPTVEWPYLRIWAESETGPGISLQKLAGGNGSQSFQLELIGTPSGGDVIELAWLTNRYDYELSSSDTLNTAAAALAAVVSADAASTQMTATASGAVITLTYTGSNPVDVMGRVWPERVYFVPIHANSQTTIIEGASTPATASFELRGTPTVGDYIQLVWLDQHFYHQVTALDTLETAVAALANEIILWNRTYGSMTAAASGTAITLTYDDDIVLGTNGNRLGVYGTVGREDGGAVTESWSPQAATFSGGTSPTKWRIALDFDNLLDRSGSRVPVARIRKMRWTWAADLQSASFERCDFQVVVTNWQLTGSGLPYKVAGIGSVRMQDLPEDVAYSNESDWSFERGNYSGGSIHWTTEPSASVRCSYTANGTHELYLGSRRAPNAAKVRVQIDQQDPFEIDLALKGEDVLVRIPLGSFAGGAAHAVTFTHAWTLGTCFYFDFVEIAYPSSDLPSFAADRRATLATDWDTYHSLTLPPERTAWLISALGFKARANHYVGAFWFYELTRKGSCYASATITISDTPIWGDVATLSIGATSYQHVCVLGETAVSLAKCFELLIDNGSTGVRATASGTDLTIISRVMGDAVSGTVIGLSPNASTAPRLVSMAGADPDSANPWLTDLTASPRINRACRDWSRGYFVAMKGYGIDVTASLSMELHNGDDSVATGIAQRYPNGDAVWVSTPALQTNFSPASTAFWQEVYKDLADQMAAAGLTPYLQFGEVQWWYNASASGMPFYDAYTTSAFQARYGRAMATISSPDADPSDYADECEFLAGLIGEFTQSVISYVRQSHPDAKFEVLYPMDTNAPALNQKVNFPKDAWMPSVLASLKTENFIYTGSRNLNSVQTSIAYPGSMGFAAAQSAHLIGIGDFTTPWLREYQLSVAGGDESVVLWALDQFCLIGYKAPLEKGTRRARRMGA
jgi:phage tail sheath gpL-like